jgi:hypothetical protein
MIGKTIYHYKILEKLRQKDGGQVGEARLPGTCLGELLEVKYD